MLNENIYRDQVWGSGYKISGEGLSANGHYTGHKVGAGMQDTLAEDNADKYSREHTIPHCGTILQDEAPNANMPEPIFVLYYHPNGGSGEIPRQYYLGEPLTIADGDELEPSGADVFHNWNTEPDESGTSYEAGDTISLTKDTVLYAIWRIGA